MRKKRVVLGLVGVCTVLLLAEMYRSNRIIEVEKITIERENLPEGFDGFRIAHVSDLHGTLFGEDNGELAEIIRAEEPDIIAITGDFVDTTSRDVDMVYATARKLVEIAPCYFVPGNHEYKEGLAPVAAELKRAGVTVLQNEAVELERNGDKITLLGVDDPNGRADMITMAEAVRLAKQREPDFLLMLNHRYSRAEEASALGTDIMLAGHAHGGLVRLPFTDGLVGPSMKLFPQHTSGHYDIDGMDLVTSRGLGNTGWARRLFNPPHLPLIELRTKQPS